jgi:hypothetical protein
MVLVYLQVIIRVFVYVLLLYQSGHRFTVQEKVNLLEGLYSLSTQFFSEYKVNESKLGSSRVEISARSDLCLSNEPDSGNEGSVHEVFQGPKVRPPVSKVSRRLFDSRETIENETHEKHRDSF